MILQIDLGNSALKWRLLGDAGVASRGVVARDRFLQLPAVSPAPEAVWISSVAGPTDEEALTAAVVEAWSVRPWFARSSRSAGGITNSYAAPERMGVDRWLAMLAAWQRVGDAVCVIDAGTALTIDFVDAEGNHRGGYILPGLDMMERALLADTDRVRFDDAPRDSLAPGDSTETAVLNGLQLAQVGAIELALSRYGNNELLVFTGGNGATAQRLLERGGELCEELVLDGLDLLGREEHGIGGAKE